MKRIFLIVCLLFSCFIVQGQSFLENGGGIYFDSTDDRFVFSGTGALKYIDYNVPWSISFWLKFYWAGIAGYSIFTDLKDWSGDAGFVFFLDYINETYLAVPGYYLKNASEKAFGGRWVSNTLTAYTGKWVHIVISYNGTGLAQTNFSCWINGTKLGNPSNYGSGDLVGSISNSQPVELGKWSNTWSCNMVMDCFYVWRKCLESKEIAYLMTHRVRGKWMEGGVNQLLACWNFDNYFQDGMLVDESGNGCNSIAVGDSPLCVRGVEGLKR